MPTFVMFTRLDPSVAQTPESLQQLEQDAMEHVRQECPDVKWVSSYAILGPFDYLDVFRAPDIDQATRVGELISTHGHAETDVWAATEWQRLKEFAQLVSSAA